MNSATRQHAFTLIELLVTMAIIGIIATVTVISIAVIANDARLASGKNTVVAALDHARALAIRDNNYVMLVFRPRLEESEQRVEALQLGATDGGLKIGQTIVVSHAVVVIALATPRGR